MADEARLIAENVARYHGIDRHPGWAALREDLDALMHRHGLELAGALLRGSKSLDQRTLDRYRGFWEGARWVIKQPEKAENALAAALRRAGIPTEGTDGD